MRLILFELSKRFKIGRVKTAQSGVTTALTRPPMAIFGRSAVVSHAFKKQFHKELQIPFLIENNNENNRTIEIER